MIKKFTPRERVLLVILCILLVFCGYYFLFYMPVSERIAAFESQNSTLDAQITDVDEKVNHMNDMKAELDKLTSSGNDLKELPAFDNRANVMNSLSVILADASQYNVSFSTVDQEESTVRRNISLSYTCKNREKALAILQKINDGPYPCLIKNCTINGGTVSVELTYFEYK